MEELLKRVLIRIIEIKRENSTFFKHNIFRFSVVVCSLFAGWLDFKEMRNVDDIKRANKARVMQT